VPGDTEPGDNAFAAGLFLGEVDSVDLDLYRTRIWGNAPQGPITITTAYEEMVLPWSGGFDVEASDPFLPGDVITVSAGAGALPVVIPIPDPFSAYASSITETVWGQIDALDHQPVQVAPWGFPSQWVQTDEHGNYAATYADVPRGAAGDVNYYTTVDYAQVGFHRRFYSPDLIFTVNAADDWVETSYDPGHRLWITVTNSVGDVKATLVTTTTVVPWWDGGTGYSTPMDNSLWTPSRPDIQPGDWVYGAIDTGYTTSVRIGTITGDMDVENDQVTGIVSATWFSERLNANCWVDGANASWPNFTVDPDGGGYTCDLASVPFDLQPNQSVGVQYQEPDGDYVRHTFRLPPPPLVAAFAYAPHPPHLLEGEAMVFTDTSTHGLSPIVAWAWDFGDGGASDAQNPTHVYEAAGHYTVTLTITDALGYSDSEVKANLALVSEVEIEVQPGVEQTLTHTTTEGITTTIHIPAGSVSETTTLFFSVVETPTTPSGFEFAGRAFALDAYSGTEALEGYVFLNPITVTIYYAEADVAGLDEDTLALKYWDVSQGEWVEAACGPYDRHPGENWLAAPICHLSQFGLFAPTVHKLYLPVIWKSP